ncbi:MAG: metal-binding protein [Symploca sp. SIO3C6]|nr:metal-binding protein [Symploca sp. SIO3C6]NET03782.1 metal-binding protein [Symploca sp. SIO2B6]
MPSGQTHDRITLWSLPVVSGLCVTLTKSSDLTLMLSAGFLFGGLMFGPDLDIYSRQFKRWGWLRWIWIPYQKSMRHRSVLSHGLLIGTTLRVVYLAIWIVGLGVLGVLLVGLVTDVSWSQQQFRKEAIAFCSKYRFELIALFVGLEMGAMLHCVSDWTHSTYKRWQRQRHQPKLKDNVGKGLYSRDSPHKRKAKTKKNQKK